MWLNTVHKMCPKEIADLLLLSERTVYRYIELFHTTGEIEPKDGKVGIKRTLSNLEQFTLLQALIHYPKLYPSELQEQLYDATGR